MTLALGALAAAVAATGTAAGSRLTRGHPRWTKQNYRDREVSLALGPAVGVAATAGLLAAGGRTHRHALLAVGTAAAVGAYDDMYGTRHALGLRGHGKALVQGRVTTGVIKLVAMTGAAAIASRGEHRRTVDAMLATVLVAGGANVVNLFDLRPGRAAKVSLLAAAALSRGADQGAREVTAIAVGAALASLPADLSERAMLGDAGAATLGALLGWAASRGPSRRRRTALATVVVGLTLASELVSFSAVIDGQPLLRAVDRLGRQGR